jgi:hypothetical protein
MLFVGLLLQEVQVQVGQNSRLGVHLLEYYLYNYPFPNYSSNVFNG